MGDWEQYPVERAPQQGVEVDMPVVVPNLADEAKADRAAGHATVGTRGYADTEAFERGRR